MPYDGKCKWCGRTFNKPSLISIKSAIQGDRKNYCSDKCYSEATGSGGSGGGGGGGGSSSGVSSVHYTGESPEAIEARQRAEREQRFESKVESISKITFSSDVHQIEETLNELATLGASKPDKEVRNVIVEKMEFGIMKLRNAGMHSEATFFAAKVEKIKPQWFDL